MSYDNEQFMGSRPLDAETPRTDERATLTLEECEQLEDAWIDAERSSDLRPAVEEIVTDRLAAAVARAEAAEDWKAQALPVISGLQELGKALGLRLGTSITGPDAAEAARSLNSRAEAAEAAADELAAAVTLLAHDAHPVYGSTAGHHGGIGGQAMTAGCSIIDPPPGVMWTQLDMPTQPARDWLRTRDVDLDAIKARLRDRWTAALAPATTEETR